MKEKATHIISLVFNGRQTRVGTVIELHKLQAIEMVLFVLFCTDANVEAFENTYTERNLSFCHVNFYRWL